MQIILFYLELIMQPLLMSCLQLFLTCAPLPVRSETSSAVSGGGCGSSHVILLVHLERKETTTGRTQYTGWKIDM